MIISDIEQMESLILPQYFRHGNFPSFIRQVYYIFIYSSICTTFTNFTKKTSWLPSKTSSLKKETKKTFILYKEEKKSNNSSLLVCSFKEKMKIY